MPGAISINKPDLATYFKWFNWASGNCLDVNAADLTLQEWTCNGNANQRFTPLELGNGYYQIRVKQPPGATPKCLQADSAAGTIKQAACSSTAMSQQVQIASSTYFQVMFLNTGRCVDFNSSSSGLKSLQRTCNTAASQQFNLVE